MNVYELDMVSLDHFSTILPLMVLHFCCFGQQFCVKVNDKDGLFH